RRPPLILAGSSRRRERQAALSVESLAGAPAAGELVDGALDHLPDRGTRGITAGEQFVDAGTGTLLGDWPVLLEHHLCCAAGIGIQHRELAHMIRSAVLPRNPTPAPNASPSAAPAEGMTSVRLFPALDMARGEWRRLNQ